jgi:hypothetical protein
MRFASGLRWLDVRPGQPPETPAVDPSVIRADVIRPADLVALAVEAVGCELVSDGAEPAHLRPIADHRSPRLVVRYAYQHLGEEAVYEGQAGKTIEPNELRPQDGPKTSPGTPDLQARPVAPIGARAARGSRVVFKIPGAEKIEFSTAGILDAMARLPLNVHTLAVPGDAPAAGTTGSAALPGSLVEPWRVVVGDLVGTVASDAVTFTKASRQDLRSLGVPPRSTLSSVAFQAREMRLARTLLQTRTGVVTSRSLVRDRPIAGELIGGIVGPTRDVGMRSRQPKPDETAIEAPFRLVISPSHEARFAHAIEPVESGGGTPHVELWHSRLGNLGVRPDGSTFTDEKNARRRIVRAVWARDRERMPPRDWQIATRNLPTHSINDPFRMSLDGADRQMLVQQSSETVRGRRRLIEPTAVAARSLWLSGLGAWLDLHGAWNTLPYSDAEIRSILAWDHVAPMGRDQFVRVVYPGYLFPWGHQAALVKITERKMKDASPSLAALYQRKFLVISEPRRTYADRHELSFTEVTIRPLMTPPLDEPSETPGDSQDSFFWPHIDKQPLRFVIDALDHDGKPQRLPAMPLMWVAEHYKKFDLINQAYDNAPWRAVDAHGQSIAFAPSRQGGDTRLTTTRLRFRGRAELGTSTPYMSSAEVRVPAVDALSPPPAAVPIAYGDLYRAKGFANPANPGEIWAEVLVAGDKPGQLPSDPVTALPMLRFGEGAPSSSDRAGGFLAPNIPIRGLSRLAGVVGDPAGMAARQFKPKEFFKGSLPKLFGLIDLSDLAVEVDSDLLRMPQVISEFLGRVEGLINEMGRATAAIAEAVAEADAMLANAALQDPAVRQQWKKQAEEAVDAADLAQLAFEGLDDKLNALVKLISAQGDSAAVVKQARDQFIGSLDSAIEGMKTLAEKMPPFMAKLLRSIADALKAFIKDVATLATDIAQYVQGLAESGSLARVRFEWKPRVASWPTPTPLIELKPDSLVLAVQAKAGFDGKGSTQVLAELRDFTLHLFPDAELISLKFTRFSFIVDGTKKPEVDIVFDDIGFHGVLSFVAAIRKLIPLDGFSDPPEIRVTPDGLTAGFSVALPDIALGMFSITNLSLGADVQVPFLGKAVTVGFNFCTRERPFTIAVAFLGGGGWCGIRASAEGLEVLEVGLEAGACIAVNFGVASGSVSAMLGVYIRIESEAGSITGYFRLRGEVDVLGLVSAAIELYMALSYLYDTGKLVGEARITVNVTVMGLSKSVGIHARRTFAGSNGDPSFLEVMGAESGSSPAWSQYCMAFTEE